VVGAEEKAIKTRGEQEEVAEERLGCLRVLAKGRIIQKKPQIKKGHGTRGRCRAANPNGVTGDRRGGRRRRCSWVALVFV